MVNANHSVALSSHRICGNWHLAAASTKSLRHCNISKERKSQRERVLNQARLNPKPTFPALCQSPPWPLVETAALCGRFWARPVLHTWKLHYYEMNRLNLLSFVAVLQWKASGSRELQKNNFKQVCRWHHWNELVHLEFWTANERQWQRWRCVLSPWRGGISDPAWSCVSTFCASLHSVRYVAAGLSKVT